MSKTLLRREFLERLSLATGSVILLPGLPGCGGGASASGAGTSTAPDAQPSVPALTIPRAKPANWDAIAFNKERGNAGAIPATYLPSINGADGVEKHLGKHLPYIPEVDPSLVPEGFLPLMWGDPSRGYAPHPNAVRSEKNNFEGHWYNWIRVRAATDGDATEEESRFSEWPAPAPADTGRYAAFAAKEIESDDGKNTIYLVTRPKGLAAGSDVRIHAHCLTHGEYVDFVTLRA